MKQKSSQKNNKYEEFTYDEYLKRFYPKSNKRLKIGDDYPSKIGISLARVSLSKIQRILSPLHE